jgi:hypothetical protein
MSATPSIIMYIACFLVFNCFSAAQENIIVPDLSKITSEDGWRIVNRNVKLLNEGDNSVVYLDSHSGDGKIWLKDLDFKNGVIEFDVKGKDAQGSSFVGIAFRGINDTTYDAVYFRPFNFLNKDSVRKSHSVQYISCPKYSWEKLRNDFPGKYENVVNPVPDPNLFFHAKIIIQKPKISVFVNNSSEPSLVIDELSGRTGGLIGLWTGNYSEGYFSNLKIITKN